MAVENELSPHVIQNSAYQFMRCRYRLFHKRPGNQVDGFAAVWGIMPYKGLNISQCSRPVTNATNIPERDDSSRGCFDIPEICRCFTGEPTHHISPVSMAMETHQESASGKLNKSTAD